MRSGRIIDHGSRPAAVPAAVASLAEWVRAGVLGSAEVHGAAVLVRAARANDEALHLAAALALWAPLHGHACIDLADAAATVEAAIAFDQFDEGDADDLRTARHLPWPEPDEWQMALAASQICRVVTAVDDEPILDRHPLVLHGTLLYTQRQWVDECTVAADLRRRARLGSAAAEPLDAASAQLLESLIPAVESGRPNQQHEAAQLALRSHLAVVIGGPGTGKTHTIARVLAVMLQRAGADGRSARIALAAPTGKAAARMGEAISASIARLSALASADDNGPIIHQDSIDQLTALRPTTIHRLLGVRGRRTRFENNSDHPLDHDIVVIDEASMVALPMMARLLEALRADATLVLVGDPDQLESIEVGSVLADIVTACTAPTSPLARCVVRLDRSHRQAEDSPIGPLADAIRLARTDEVVRLLTTSSASNSNDPSSVTFIDTDVAAPDAVELAIRNSVVPPLQAAAAAARSGRASAALGQFADVRVLCAHRRGPNGVERWNRLIESWLLADSPAPRPPRYYAGRPLLVTRNDQRQRISNGDTGIIVAGEAGLRAAFATAEGLRLLAPAQLDTVETAFAMTIHKSQGSEYATVVVILPPAGSALIGRELLYTAITRATRRLVVVGSSAAVVAAVDTPGCRVTGLAAALS